MNIEHLLARAGRAVRGKKRPRQTDLRRQTSDVYYALFHALCLECANALAGSKNKSTPAWNRVYRALDHKQAKQMLAQTLTQKIEPAIAAFATVFILLQDERQRADYDPRPFPHRKLQVRNFRDEARLAIRGLRKLSVADKRLLALNVLFRERS